VLGRRVLRRAPALFFLAVLVCFALPFATVSCDGPPVTASGYELVTFHVADDHAGRDDVAELERDGGVIAVSILVVTVAGLAVALARPALGSFFVSCLVGLFTCAIGIGRANRDLFGAPELRAGFELVCVLYLSGTLGSLVGLVRRRRRRLAASATTPEPRAVV
jgi:hypothetical protein